jgi:hypothetical protein
VRGISVGTGLNEWPEALIMQKIIHIGVYFTLSILIVYGCSSITASLIETKSFDRVEVSESHQTKIRIKAHLMESANSVDKVETAVEGQILIIKVYKKYVLFVPKDKLQDKLDTEIIIPDNVNEVRFYNDNKVLWSRHQ